MIVSVKQIYRLPCLLAALLFCLACVNITCAQTTAPPPIPKPNPPRLVVDYADVVDAATEQRLETILENVQQRAGIEFAVVTVKTIGDREVFDYGLAIARGWGIGPGSGEKEGLLLLVAVDDHKYNIQVSRHLEGDLPDGMTGEVNRRMRPAFREGDYGRGLTEAVNTYVATLGKARGFSIEGIDQSAAYDGAPAQDYRSPRRGGISPCAIIFIIAIVLIFLMSSRGRGGGGGGGGCLNLLLLNSLLNSGGSSGGWGSGGGWGGGSSGGGGGGGFGGFGGGGDFGGGGSSGSW
jgi:uncharacterized protein